MPTVWDSVAIAVGSIAIAISGVSLWLTFHDRRVGRQMIEALRREVARLRDRLRKWEGWGRLVCAIAADVNLELPGSPAGIDEE